LSEYQEMVLPSLTMKKKQLRNRTRTGSWQGRRCGQLQARLVMKMKRKKMNLHQYCHLPFLRPLPQPVCIAGCLEARQAHVMLVPDLSTQ
jgi:hypothetical protein